MDPYVLGFWGGRGPNPHQGAHVTEPPPPPSYTPTRVSSWSKQETKGFGSQCLDFLFNMITGDRWRVSYGPIIQFTLFAGLTFLAQESVHAPNFVPSCCFDRMAASFEQDVQDALGAHVWMCNVVDMWAEQHWAGDVSCSGSNSRTGIPIASRGVSAVLMDNGGSTTGCHHGRQTWSSNCPCSSNKSGPC